jgi:hypothetical protein
MKGTGFSPYIKGKGKSRALAPEGSLNPCTGKVDGMQNLRKLFPVIFSACIFVIFSIAILISDLWKRHDSSNLLLHMSLLLNGSVLLGAFIWLEQQWKYLRLAGWTAFVLCSGSLAIQRFNGTSFWGVAIQAVFVLWGSIQIKREIGKLKPFGDPNQRNSIDA